MGVGTGENDNKEGHLRDRSVLSDVTNGCFCRNLDMGMANEYLNEGRNLETGKYEGKMASLIKDSTET